MRNKLKYSYYGAPTPPPSPPLLPSEWMAVWSEGTTRLEDSPVIVATYSGTTIPCESNFNAIVANISSIKIGYPGNGQINIGDIICEYTNSQGIRFYFIKTGVDSWDLRIDVPNYSTMTAFGAGCSNPPTGILSYTIDVVPTPIVSVTGTLPSNSTQIVYSGTGNIAFGSLPFLTYYIEDSGSGCFISQGSILVDLNLSTQYRFTQRLNDCYNYLVGTGLSFDNTFVSTTFVNFDSTEIYEYNGVSYYTGIIRFQWKGDYIQDFSAVYNSGIVTYQFLFIF